MLWHITGWGATICTSLGVLVRLTVKDDLDVLAPVFYGTPWPVLLFGAIVTLIYWWAQRRVRFTCAGVAAVCLIAWLWTGFRFHAPPLAHADFRIAYWNCARPGWRLDGILVKAKSFNPDVLGIGESRAGGPVSPRWAEAFPSLRVFSPVREMLFGGPADTNPLSSGTLGMAGVYQLYSMTLKGREVFVLLVDFDGDIRQTRRPAFDRLMQLVDGYATKPLIVLGDFNTPTDSVYFSRLREKMNDAFSTAGVGCAATWPMIAPVLSIDHVLVNKHLRVVRCEHQNSLYSDHRAIVVDVAWP